MIKIKKGLDLPIRGDPEQIVKSVRTPNRVAVLGGDYIGLRPTMAVGENDPVKKGQLLFTDKRMPGVKFTAPAGGRVVAINRGEKRVLLSVVIEVIGDEEVTFAAFPKDRLPSLGRSAITDQLLDSGLWTALRARPFSKVANPKNTPHSLFINAMDSNPLAPKIEKILEGNEHDFVDGCRILSQLTQGRLFLCKAPETWLPEMDIANLAVAEFKGPHPAGNVGTHIHFLDPVHRAKSVWHIGLQDVIAVGRLFTTGRLCSERIIALAGPAVKNPRLIRTTLGASLDELAAGELSEGENRIISGSVLSGRAASGATAYLGRYHQQVSVLAEGRRRAFLGWLDPGFNLYSVKNVVLSKLTPGKKFAFTTSTQGEVRAILPSYNYERVMPLDIMPLFLIRALAVNDVEEAEQLGCLELDEEDLALCAFVCPSKLEFGPMLRRNLTSIEEEG